MFLTSLASPYGLAHQRRGADLLPPLLAALGRGDGLRQQRQRCTGRRVSQAASLCTQHLHLNS